MIWIPLADLLRVDVEYFGSVSAGDGHISARVHFSRMHTLLPDYGHSVLHSVHPVWYFTEIVLA